MPPIHRGIDSHASNAQDGPSDDLGIRGGGTPPTDTQVKNMPMPPGLGGV